MKTKIIRDPLHGYIEVDQHVLNIIRTDIFARLHDILAPGPAYMVYPSLRVSRFTHSLGVYHLSRLYLRSLLQNTPSNIKELLLEREGIRESNVPEYLEKVVSFAGLLHDIGHGPFSHTSELFLENVIGKNTDEKLIQEGIDRDILEHAKIHEKIGWLIILRKLSNELQGIEPRDVVSVLCGHAIKGSQLTELQAQILHRIISSNIDADRLDYIPRDGYFSGVPFGGLDVTRIIINASIAKLGNNYVIAFNPRALSAIEHFLIARYLLYEYLYFHHIVNLYELLLEFTLFYLYAASEVDNKMFDPERDEFISFTDDYVLTKLYDIRSHIKRGDSCIDIDIRGQHISIPIIVLEGLFDRQKLPVSVWKRFADFIVDLDRTIMPFLLRKYGSQYANKIWKIIKELFTPEKKDAWRYGSQVYDILSSLGRKEAYAPIILNKYKAYNIYEKIYIVSPQGYSGIEYMVDEVTRYSIIVRGIEKEWYPGRLFFYYHSGKQDFNRDKARRDIEKIKTLILEVLRHLIDERISKDFSKGD